MTQFAFTDAYDAYGQPRRQVSLAVPRHRDYRAPAPAGAPYLGTLAETQYAQRDDASGTSLIASPASTSFEILNDGSPTVFELYRQLQAGTAARTLVGQTFNYYDGEAFVGLPFGELGDFGALVRSESLVLTEEILREAYWRSGGSCCAEPAALSAAGRRDELAGGIPEGIPSETPSPGRLHLRRWVGPPGPRLLRPWLSRRIRFSQAKLASARAPR